MIVQQLTETEADARIRELEYLAKGLENMASSLISDIRNPESFRRQQDNLKASIERWTRIHALNEERFAAGQQMAAQYASRARELRQDAAILKKRRKIEELLALGALLHEAEAALGDNGASILCAINDKNVAKLIEANAGAMTP